jgi:hypothetical protein
MSVFGHNSEKMTAKRHLAGEEGFEPSHVGIKIRCLNQLGDSPALEADLTQPPKNAVFARLEADPTKDVHSVFCKL